MSDIELYKTFLEFSARLGRCGIQGKIQIGMKREDMLRLAVECGFPLTEKRYHGRKMGMNEGTVELEVFDGSLDPEFDRLRIQDLPDRVKQLTLAHATLQDLLSVELDRITATLNELQPRRRV